MSTPPSPPPPVSNELRQRILCEATRLFGAHGYGSTSVRQVAEAVGCTKPSLYYWFGSKEKLFLEACRAALDTFAVTMDEALAGGGTVRARLRRLIAAHLRHMGTHRDEMRLLMTVKHRPDAGQPEVDTMSVHIRNGEKLQGLLAEGVQSGELRADLPLEDAMFALIGMVNMRAHCQLEGLPVPDDVVDRVLDLYLRGVAP